MTEVKFLRDGDTVYGRYAVIAKHWLKDYRSKSGKTGKFFALELGDKTGEIGLKFWGIGGEEEKITALYNSIKVGDVLEVTGNAIIDQYEKRLIISVNEETQYLRICKPEEYEPEDFIPTTKKDKDKMTLELLSIIKSVRNASLSALLHAFFDDAEFLETFCAAPASQSIHQSYLGGNLEHVLNVVTLCETLCGIYPELNRDLLVTAALLHDIGKLEEYRWSTIIERTDVGRLAGHIVLGEKLVMKKIETLEEFPVELKLKLSHILLSHHGREDWGSPVEVKTIEACALHYADLLDARLGMFVQAIERPDIKDAKWAKIQRHEIYLG